MYLLMGLMEVRGGVVKRKKSREEHDRRFLEEGAKTELALAEIAVSAS